MEPEIIKISTFKSSQGNLSIIDKKNNIPFEVKRIFYIYYIPQNTQEEGT